MTNNAFILAGSYSIAIAAVIGLIRLQKIYVAYQPFIFITMASFLNEVVSHILITHQKSNAIAINIFGLFDALLWLWQFRRWNTHQKRRILFKVAAPVLIILWFVENIAFGKLFIFGSIYPITFSLLMVLFAAIEAGRQIAKEKRSLLMTPKFMICSGAILFYTYRMFIECFYVTGISGSNNFLGNLFTIVSFINFIVNLLYALVVICIPEKQKFSLPFY